MRKQRLLLLRILGEHSWMALCAHLGQLHPEIAAARKLRRAFRCGNLFDRLYPQDCAWFVISPCRGIRRERDFSFVFDDGVTFEKFSTVYRLGLSEFAQLCSGGDFPRGKSCGQVFAASAGPSSVGDARCGKMSGCVVGAKS